MDVFIRYAKDRQIIVSTHSPYFISWDSIISGGNLVRVFKDENENIQCYTLGNNIKEKFKGIIADLNNPHVLGLQANEIFFLYDNIILVEGQEDVIIFNRILRKMGIQLNGNFFGWGVGGATKMETFLELFTELGYRKVTAIYDGDKKEEMEKNKIKYANYNFLILPTDDIRDKEVRSMPSKSGITNKNGEIKPEYKKWMRDIISDINNYFANTGPCAVEESVQ